MSRKPLHALDALARLRARGHRGGAIPQHRALWSLTLPRHRVFAGVVLACALSGVLLWLRPWIGWAWSATLVWWMHALALPGVFDVTGLVGSGVFGLSVPTVALELPLPDPWAPVWNGAVVAMLWWCTGWMPDAGKPVAFFIRLGALVHGSAVLFFFFWPASFVHSVTEHVVSGLRQGWYLMLLTPWIHLLTYYLFPFAHWQRALLSLLTIFYLAVLTPLQYALHIALVHRVGLILLPLLHLLFGVMLAIIGFVALYGWGMSWPGRGALSGKAD